MYHQQQRPLKSPRRTEKWACSSSAWCSLVFLYDIHLDKCDSPDKNPNTPAVHDRFARLGVVSTILRNAESRKRYVVGVLTSFTTFLIYLTQTDTISSTKMVYRDGEVLDITMNDSGLDLGWDRCCHVLYDGIDICTVRFRVLGNPHVGFAIRDSRHKLQEGSGAHWAIHRRSKTGCLGL